MRRGVTTALPIGQDADIAIVRLDLKKGAGLKHVIGDFVEYDVRHDLGVSGFFRLLPAGWFGFGGAGLAAFVLTAVLFSGFFSRRSFRLGFDQIAVGNAPAHEKG